MSNNNDFRKIYEESEQQFLANATPVEGEATNGKTEAKSLLASADIDPEDYSFELTVATYDEAHNIIAEMIVASWCELGFDVEINNRGTVANNDYYKPTDSVPTDICDNLYAEDLRDGKFEVVLLDLVAPSVDPFSVLAPFALQFSGSAMDMSVADSYELTPHITGYNSEEYNAVMEEVFNEKVIANRSEKLHKAEDILMEDMPVMPIIFNKIASVVNEDALKMNVNKKMTNYYNMNTLKKIEVKDFEAYVANVASFIESKFETYKQNPLSYFGSETYSLLTFEQFKEESSNYAYFFKERTAEK
jgi:ABC-type transport system substrate-binding protein